MFNTTKIAESAENVTEISPQLLLELEMDDEVTEIINFPEKFANTYLDVTVIKPRDNHLCTTEKKIMSGEQVKQFITAMNLGKEREILTKKNTNNYAKGDHIKIPPFSEASNSENENIQQVYNTTELNSVFKCKNRQSMSEKCSPCVCKNCAIVGLVSDSQKRPFITEPIKDPQEAYKKRNFNEENIRKKKENDHQHCQYYFKHLSEKIRVLEERVAAQEQKAVPKEYFKKIVTKLLNHFSRANYGGQIKIETIPEKVKPTQTIPRQKFIVNPVLVQNTPEEDSPTGSWKWREDILKPGIDLKNKIISVMEDTLTSLKKSRDKPKDDELKQFINEFSNNLYKTISDETKYKIDSNLCDFNGKSKRRNAHRNKTNLGAPVSVTYVNSQVLKWKDTQTTFKFDSDRESLQNLLEKKKTQEIHKYEFLKTIKNTKEEDKRRLWQSIWEQASKNGHNRNDKVTVQMPDKNNPKKECVEVDYTLGDLEYLLLGNRAGRR